MKLKRGKYTIKSDAYNIWIEKDYEVKNKHKDGTESTKVRSRNITGFHRTWSSLMREFVGRSVKESDAEEIQELMADIAEAQRTALELSIAAYEEGRAMK